MADYRSLADLMTGPDPPKATMPSGTLAGLSDPMQALQRAQSIGAAPDPHIIGQMPVGPGFAQMVGAGLGSPAQFYQVLKKIAADNALGYGPVAMKKAWQLLMSRPVAGQPEQQ